MPRYAALLFAAAVLAGCGSDRREDDRAATTPPDCQAVIQLREAGGSASGVKGLSKLGKNAMPTLIFIMTGDDTPEAIAAAEEAAALGADAIPGLTALLQSRAPRGRGWAAWAMGRIGPAAKGAIPALEKAAADPELKLVATEALSRIGK